MKKFHALPAALSLTACLSLGLAGFAGSALAGPGSVAQAPARERPVITDVSGDAANGFHVTYADGSAIFPPTDSEASAECGEYDTRIARVRCRVEVRTWYRDLGDLKRSLAHVRAEQT